MGDNPSMIMEGVFIFLTPGNNFSFSHESFRYCHPCQRHLCIYWYWSSWCVANALAQCRVDWKQRYWGSVKCRLVCRVCKKLLMMSPNFDAKSALKIFKWNSILGMILRSCLFSRSSKSSLRNGMPRAVRVALWMVRSSNFSWPILFCDQTGAQ